MNKKTLGVVVGIAAIISVAITVLTISSSEIIPIQANEKIGLVINSPNQSVTLQELDQIYSKASSTGIGRSNVYLFWNLVEPVREEYDWQQSDTLLSLNKKNNLKFTL
ncbi:MAG: hypothetical protein IIB02_01755, partial [Thaumarchaeota archaeon]|nr:hypothetical protein [Nitrososphaerota archaeon]